MNDVASSVEQMSGVNGLTHPAEWLSKADAAEFLGVSPRQIERRAAAGYVETRRLPRRPTERSERVEYSREDLEALRAGNPNQHGIPEPALRQESGDPAGEPPKSVAISTVEPQRPAALERPAALAPASLLGELGTLLGAFTAAVAPAPAVKPWLTLREAAEYSGLPAAWLDREAKAGRLGLNVGSEKRASWRFHREALSGRFT